MTQEWHPADGTGKTGEEQAMEDILEQRLKFYYGPKLPEQPLPESSWQQVASKLLQYPLTDRRKEENQALLPPSPDVGDSNITIPNRSSGFVLGSQRQRHLRQHFWSRFKRRGYAFPFPANAFPLDAQGAFAQILHDAHLSYSTHMLACRWGTTRTRRYSIQVPRIHVSLLRRRPLRLTLPTHIDIKPAELDVLLAGGLARYEEMRRPTSILLYTLSVGAIASLFGGAIIALLVQGLPLLTRIFDVLACISLIGVILWWLNLHARKLARRADTRMVDWIGRFRACQGLHALADRTRVPSQRRWGELSLTERIARICGMRVPIQEKHFTLVR